MTASDAFRKFRAIPETPSFSDAPDYYAQLRELAGDLVDALDAAESKVAELTDEVNELRSRVEE